MRIPPNFFGIAFGLTGLSVAWHTSRAVLGVPVAVSDTIAILAAVVWLVLAGCYLAQGRARIGADLKDPVLAPFLAGAVIAARTMVAIARGQFLPDEERLEDLGPVPASSTP
jgi:tellurite resistance protein